MADFDVTEGLLASGELLLTKKQSPAQREAAQVRPTMHCAFTPSSLTNDPNPIHFAAQTANDFGITTAITRDMAASIPAHIPERSAAPIGRARSPTIRASSSALSSGIPCKRA